MKRLLGIFKRSHSSRLVLFGYMLISLFLLFNISHFKSFDQQLEQHYQQLVWSERQVALIDEMHLHGRNRSIHLLEMTLTNDPFKIEELTQAFNHSASHFILARKELQTYPLTKDQSELLQKQGKRSILNAQQQQMIVDLIHNQEQQKAQALLLDTTLPEQTRILDMLKPLSVSLNVSAEQASIIYQETIQEDEHYASLLHLSLLLLILLVGVYSYRQTRINEQQQTEQLQNLTHEVMSQTQTNAMDALILSEVSDYIALINQKGEFIRTNPNFEKIINLYTKEQPNNIWSVFEFFTERSTDLITSIQNKILTGQAWRNEVRFIAPLDFYCLCEVRPFKSDEITNAAYLVVMSDTSELKSVQQALETQANFDAITELPNRHYFQSQLAFQTQTSSDYFALFYIDLDDFKHVNDSLGHDYGDHLLKAVSYRMQNLLLDKALNHFTLARIGGDEFAVILKQDSKHSLQALSKTVAQALCETVAAPYEIFSKHIEIGCSIGVAIFPEQEDSATGIMRCADLAMYDAKEKGKNTYTLFTQCMNNKLEEQLKLEQELVDALKNEDLVLYFQQQFNLQDLSLSGMEALLRWQTPTKIIMPSDFIPFAEKHRLIEKTDSYVLKQACKQIQAWQQAGLTPPRLAINISSQQLNDGLFFENIHQLLNTYQLSGTSIELEVTEYSIVENIEQHSSKQNSSLSKLHDLGVQISIDDFGTGYSSLAYLKHLNLDRLKIDRSFIHDMTTNKDSLSIVKSIITLGHNVGAKVLAEGIETQEQLQLLQALGCDEGQGYFLHKPATSDDITSQLSSITP